MDVPGHAHVRRLVRGAALLLLLGGLYGPSLLAHARHSTNRLRCTDDVRQHIPPFLNAYDSALLADDAVSDYIMRIRPWGYQRFYRAAARFVDPREICNLLMYPLLLLTVALCGLSAGRLAGPAAGWVTVALALSSEYLLDRMSGGLPRTFAFPCFAGAVACLVWGRYIGAGVCIVLAAAFYPTVGVPAGFALALVLLVLPREDRGPAAGWPWRRRVALVAATAVASALTMLPTVLASRDYGPLIFRAEDAGAYPEIGSGGRLHRVDRMSYARGLFEDTWELTGLTLRNDGDAWSESLRNYTMKDKPPYNKHSSRLRRLKRGVLAVLALGAGIMAVGSPAGRRLLAVWLAVCLAFVLARTFPPYLFLPQRHLYYPLPVLFLIGIPVCTTLVFRVLLGRLPAVVRPARAVIDTVPVVVVGVMLLLLTGGRIPDNDHVKSMFSGIEKRLLDTVAALPPDALVAGWPAGPIENVPYVAARRALLTRETHLTWHQQYMDEMRRRMGLFLRAYYAVNPGPLIDLRETYGVTHLIIDERHFKRPPPSYFHPFDTWITAVFEAADGHYELMRQRRRLAIWHERPYWLIELERVR